MVNIVPRSLGENSSAPEVKPPKTERKEKIFQPVALTEEPRQREALTDIEDGFEDAFEQSETPEQPEAPETGATNDHPDGTPETLAEAIKNKNEARYVTAMDQVPTGEGARYGLTARDMASLRAMAAYDLG